MKLGKDVVMNQGIAELGDIGWETREGSKRKSRPQPAAVGRGLRMYPGGLAHHFQSSPKPWGMTLSYFMDKGGGVTCPKLQRCKGRIQITVSIACVYRAQKSPSPFLPVVLPPSPPDASCPLSLMASAQPVG